ncbi:transcriptional regulator, TetR family [Bryocella elongata]|uniref:Transcriptional regulator, TetR family n=1 Tax=Bryocella elongata TaxID=863522 RepID=A0A1H5ZDV7_9BACT|nr:TetR family transcriptional regulator [Bryocella elongata]SEG33915.1 transcriptional regulator, TetR family [Bryocella elongata]
MAPEKLNKHEQKTRETRASLLKAAEEIFLRDGYERAELGEIAKLAGRTKGAIYAHFAGKEEVFLALVELHALRRRALMQEYLAAAKTKEDNLRAFRQLYLAYAEDGTWGRLLMEFNFYALRHPESKKNLDRVYATIVAEDEEARYTELLGVPRKGKLAVRRTASVYGAFAMLTGLMLQSMFNPRTVSEDEVKKLAAKVFDAVFDMN